jgi:hypothetical protein
LLSEIFRIRHRLLEHGASFIEGVCLMLREIADADIMTRQALTCLDVNKPGEDFQEGRFAGPVRPDQDRALAALDCEVEIFIDGMISEACRTRSSLIARRPARAG